MPNVRTFIAIETGKAVRGRLVALQETFMRAGVKAKWVDAENIHITLLFLGEVEMTTIPEVCAAVTDAVQNHAVFPMTIGTTGCFPNIRRPRILWAGVQQGAQEICAIHDEIEEALLELGCYRKEERKFTPHLTLGRLQKEKSDVDLASILEKHADWQGGESKVEEILVMGSELTPKGPIYTVLSRAKLASS